VMRADESDPLTYAAAFAVILGLRMYVGLFGTRKHTEKT
jgi:hypothetical protein